MQIPSSSKLDTCNKYTLLLPLNSNRMKKKWMTQGYPFKFTGLAVQEERKGQQVLLMSERKNISYTDDYLRRNGAVDGSTIYTPNNVYMSLEYL